MKQQKRLYYVSGDYVMDGRKPIHVNRAETHAVSADAAERNINHRYYEDNGCGRLRNVEVISAINDGEINLFSEGPGRLAFKAWREKQREAM